MFSRRIFAKTGRVEFFSSVAGEFGFPADRSLSTASCRGAGRRERGMLEIHASLPRLVERDCRDQPPVVRLPPVRRATIAEEAGLVGVRIEAGILEIADARARGACGDIAVQIEHRATLLDARDEEPRPVGVRRGESGDEFGADFVRSLRDTGPEGGANARANGAQP